MVAGVTRFPGSVVEAVSERLDADPALRKQWEEVSARFRYVFADPEKAFRSMNFDAVLADKNMARQALQKLSAEPSSIGPLKGRTGILASKVEREARRSAEINGPILKRNLERYLQMRESTAQRLAADEQAQRQCAAIDIPALSPAARGTLERVRDAIDRDDLPAALGHALSNRETKLEIDGFNKAVSERFGERTLLTNAARDPAGKLFDNLSQCLGPQEREGLKQAWPVMRTAQQLAAHERTAATLKQAADLRFTQRQSQALKQ